MAFSTVFFSNAQHFVSTNLVQYYYLKHSTAYTASSSSYKKYMANIQNVVDVFSFMNKVIECYNDKEYEVYGVTIAENYTEAMSNIEDYYGEELIEVKMFMQQEQSIYEIGNDDNEIKIDGTITGL